MFFRGKVLKQTNVKFLAHYKIVLSSKFRRPKPVTTLICLLSKWKSASHVLKKSWFSRGPLIWPSDCHFYESVSVLRDFLSSSIQRSQLITHEHSRDMGKQPSIGSLALTRFLRVVQQAWFSSAMTEVQNREDQQKISSRTFEHIWDGPISII